MVSFVHIYLRQQLKQESQPREKRDERDNGTEIN